MDQRTKPNFWTLYAEDISHDLTDRGIWAVVPYWLLPCLIVGSFVAFSIPNEFWGNKEWGASTATLSGLLAFNGILLALGWFAFAKIYEILSNTAYGEWLARKDLLGAHLLFIQFNHIVMILACVFTGGTLFLLLIEAAIWLDKIMLSLSLGTTLYSFVRAMDSTNTMNSLLWEQAEYNMQKSENFRVVSSK